MRRRTRGLRAEGMQSITADAPTELLAGLTDG